MAPPRFLHPFSRPAAPAESYLTIVSGQAAEVVDSHGRRYVDALASLWYCQAGHGRTEIVEAMTAQATQLSAWHTFDRFSNDPADALADRLAQLAPMADARVFLTSGGSEAVDSALKLARMAHHLAGDADRTLVISRRPSYHGVTYGALTATGLPANQAGFGPLMGHAVQVPHDDLDALDDVLVSQGDRVAAIVAEPLIGAGGVLPPAPGYLEGLRERCDSYGAFLVFDEVICGFGRLGAWFASDTYGVTPDLLTFAKGVTSGYQPVGGVLVGPAVRARLESDEGFVLRHGHTYSGHPVACAAALANLDVLASEGLCERAPAVGERLAAGLREAAAGAGDQVVDVRGGGAVWGVELAPGVPAVAVRDAMLGHGVIARPLGDSVVAFCPPLVVTDEQVDRCAEALAAAVAEVTAGAAEAGPVAG